MAAVLAVFSMGAAPAPAQTLPSRIVEVLSDEKSVTLIAVLDEHLDLAARLKHDAPLSDPALVPLAPPLVVGQGEDPSNQTFVRILNRYGIAEASFLAFTPSVRGGVAVAAGRDARGQTVIAAAPLAAPEIHEVRLFNRLGGQIGSIRPSPNVSAPYKMVCGDFLPQSGDEVALTARAQNGNATILIFDFAGTLRKTILVAARGTDTVALAALPAALPAAGGAGLALYFQAQKRLCEVRPASGAVAARILALQGAERAIYATAFSATDLVATGPEPLYSTLERIGPANIRPVDVGQHENEFWINAAEHGITEEGRYVKNAPYVHARVELASPAAKNPLLAQSEDPHDWKIISDAGRNDARLKTPLTEQPRRQWEPTFTHRMPGRSFAAWETIKDEQTGLPKYLSLTRKNNPANYGEFSTTFTSATYALGMPELDRLYLLPLRGFLDTLAVRHREAPERILAVEPNHEHEVAIEQDETIGDYNPAFIRGYSLYLQQMLGLDENGVKARYGLPLAQPFDAPRNTQRGAWDAYSEANPFFLDWTTYNRYVINRRLSDTFTQALLAGFAPEVIKSHQIPDIFAVGAAKGFSHVRSRITPLDYAMSAGVGFGYTRYGVWFEAKDQIQKAAQTSGFDSVTIGEYQALTDQQPTASNQLNYLFENGVANAHGMVWPGKSGREKFNPTMMGAIRELIAHDRPRPGVTGGVGQVVPVRDGARRFDIAAIGTGPQHTGLLKSLQEDGSWEGSVYAVPFRTAIEVVELKPLWINLPGGARRLSIGPLHQLESGEQIEVTMRVTSPQKRALQFAVRHIDDPGSIGTGNDGGQSLAGLSYALPISGSKNLRLLLRFPMPSDGIALTLDVPAGEDLKITEVRALRQTEKIARVHRGVLTGERHRGGVTFALLP